MENVLIWSRPLPNHTKKRVPMKVLLIHHPKPAKNITWLSTGSILKKIREIFNGHSQELPFWWPLCSHILHRVCLERPNFVFCCVHLKIFPSFFLSLECRLHYFAHICPQISVSIKRKWFLEILNFKTASKFSNLQNHCSITHVFWDLIHIRILGDNSNYPFEGLHSFRIWIMFLGKKEKEKCVLVNSTWIRLNVNEIWAYVPMVSPLFLQHRSSEWSNILKKFD